MAKRYKDLIQELYEPKSADEKRFFAKHVVKKNKLDKPTEDDNLFNADNINKDKTKNSDRENERGKDAKVYESVATARVEPRTDKQRNKSLYYRNLEAKRQKHPRSAMSNEEVNLDEISSGLLNRASSSASNKADAFRQSANQKVKDIIKITDPESNTIVKGKEKEADNLSKGINLDRDQQANKNRQANLFARAAARRVNKEEVELEEGMPAGVIKDKQRLSQMTDQEFAQKYKDSTEASLRAKARTHAIKDPDHYIKRRQKGMSEEVEQIEEVKREEHPEVAKLAKKHDRILKSAQDAGASDKRIQQLKDKHDKERKELNDRIEERLEAEHRYSKVNEEEVQEEVVQEEVEVLDEKLGKSATAADWIHDFVHSKDPKFAGKSVKERQKQALAAYYAKQGKEKVEEEYVIEDDNIPNPTSPGEAEKIAQRYYNMSKTAGDPQSKKHYKYISNKMYSLAKRLRRKAVMGEAADDQNQGMSTQVTVHDSHEDAKKEALRKSKLYNDIFKVLKDPVTNTYVVTHKDNLDPAGEKATVGMSHPFDIYTKGNHESFELFSDSMINEEITLADGTEANLDGDLVIKLMRLYNGLNEQNQVELVYSLHDDIDSLANILDLVNSVE